MRLPPLRWWEFFIKEEHTEVKVILEQMKSMDSSSEKFKEKLSELKEAVQHHVQEEENEVFPQVRQLMSAEELKQLVTEFREVKNTIQAEMSVASR
jgi:hemerythrin-like domain-containing protein